MSYAEQNPTRRPLPVPTALTEPHWKAAREGRLLVQRCTSCARFVFTPKAQCPRCFTTTLEWTESSGRGEIYSYTIIHRAPHPTFETPYVAAIIQLDEGWHMLSNVIGAAVEDLSVGRRVQVDFIMVEDVALPMFRLVDVAP